MKLWKSSLLIVGVAILLFLNITASAETIADGASDIYHLTWSQTTLGWSGSLTTEDKTYLDIRSVSAEEENGNLTLTMTIADVIQDSNNTLYAIFYNTTEAIYMVTYSNVLKMATGMAVGLFNFTSGEVTLSGDGKSIIATIPLIGGNEKAAFWAYAWEYPIDTSQIVEGYQGEWWGDWAPDSSFTYGTTDSGNGNGDGDGNGDGAPGFEAIAVIAAFAIALIILRRRK